MEDQFYLIFIVIVAFVLYQTWRSYKWLQRGIPKAKITGAAFQTFLRESFIYTLGIVAVLYLLSRENVLTTGFGVILAILIVYALVNILFHSAMKMMVRSEEEA